MTRSLTARPWAAPSRYIPRLLLLAFALAVATPALSGSSFKFGNFGKTQTDAPVTQVVTHNLGEVPKALIIWSPRGTTIHYNLGIGFSDGTTQRSVSAASQNQRSFSTTYSRQANKVITIVEYDGTVLAEADLVSWDSTTFTLNWTANHGSYYQVHFMVIGGSDVSAKVLDWTLPAGGGLTPVTGAGFEPDAVFHLFSRYSAATPHGFLGTGAMDAGGGQWGNSFLSVDGLADTDTQRGQSTSACIYAVDSDLTVLREASFVSMDPDGFTVGFSAGPGWSESAVSLALSGLNAKAGSFAKSSGISQSIGGVGFQPSLVIFSSFQQVAQFGPVPHARFGFGAGDGTLEGSSSLTDTDSLVQTDVGTRDTTSKIFLKSDNIDGFTDAAADLSSLDADGFTLDWTTNDAAATEILYLALGPLSSAGSDITGTVYHDVNANDTLDAGELGIGNVWVKLLDGGGSVIQVVPADFDSGAYVLMNVADGDYTVIVDDNNAVADSTSTAPVNWLFQNPLSGSLAVTVAGVDVTDEDFGLTFEFDLAADCACGYEDGVFTQTSITLDGDMADWALIFPDGDNNACDATDDSDLDYPVQSTGRNLLRTAVTYDASYFSVWTQRVGQSSNTQNFIYYADTSNDGIMQAGEPVIVAKWQGNTGTVTLERYSYDDLGSGGDPLLDPNGFADGYSMPGDLTFVKTLTMPDGAGQGSTTGTTDGTQMEWTLSWAELGVAPGSAIAWHIGSTNSNPGSAGLGAQIDDNLGGCGGQCTGSNQFAGVIITPISGSSGQTVYSSHAFTNTGNGDDLFDLTWTSSGDFAPVGVAYYVDLGTVGQYDPGVDVLLTDTDADTDLDTGVMTAGASFDLLIAIELPGPGTIGSATVTTTATSNFVPGCGGTVIPVSGSVADPVQIVPKLVKRSFEADGTPIANGTAVPRGVSVKFLVYIDNPGAVASDVSVQDVLDAAFQYQANSTKVDNTLQSSVVCPAGVCDEAAIFASVDGQSASTDGVDGDAVSYTSGSRTIDVGDGQQGNARLDIAVDSVWALVFTVTMQ